MATATGLKMEKEWIATKDKRTRRRPKNAFDHAVMDGKMVDLNAPFEVQGDKLMFPGDPRGKAANIIQCRCVTGYHPE